MNKIYKLLLANIKEVLRNKAALFWTFLFPIIFIAIFGLVYGNDDFPPLKVGLVVEDQSEEIKPLIEAIENIPVFETSNGTREELLDELNQGDVAAVIMIDSNFGQDFLERKAEIRVTYDPTNTTTSNIVTSALGAAVDNINQYITQARPPISLKSEPMQTNSTRQIEWLVPGILGMSIMQLGLFSSAAFVTAREKKIFRRIAVTPIKRHHLLISQVLFRLIFGIIQSTVLLVVGYLLYKVTIVGNIFVLAIVVCISVMMFLAMGYIVASLAKNEEVVEPLVQVFAMPMMFLSGVFFPIELMPEFIRPAVRALPLTYLNDALRAVINQGEGLLAIGNDLLVMTVWLVVSMLVAIKVFRWE